VIRVRCRIPKVGKRGERTFRTGICPLVRGEEKERNRGIFDATKSKEEGREGKGSRILRL